MTRPSPDPHRCPDCGTVLADRAGVTTCPRCGFAGTDPEAGAIWQLDVEAAALISQRAELVAEIKRIDSGIGRLGQSRAALVDRMRRERTARPPTRDAEGATAPEPPAPVGAPRGRPAPARRLPDALPGARRLSAQVLLVGLGAFLLVAAGIVFAAVTWDRLGALGQASILVGATVLATAVTLLAARARLMATAEALSVVAAGFAIVDVHGFRLVVAPDGDARMAWALGLIIVTLGLAMLARASRLRAPGLAAVVTAQPPLVLLGSLVPESGLGAATGLLVLASVDYAVARRQSRAPAPWLTGLAVPLLRFSGSAAWAVAWFPAAFASMVSIGVGTPLRGWGLGLMLLATAQLAALTLAVARRGPAERAEGYAAVLAAAATVVIVGFHVLLDPSDRGELVWAVGLTSVAAGLVVLGRTGRLRGPFIAAAILAQAPLVLLAAAADRYGPVLGGAGGARTPVALALVLVALLDFLAARRLTRGPVPWVPTFVPILVRGLGVLAWGLASILSLGPAFWSAGGDQVAVRWWAVGVLLAASAEAALLSRAGSPRRGLADLAAAASVLLSLTAVAAIAVGLRLPAERLLLVGAIAGLAIALGPVILPPRGRPSGDSRVRAGQGLALVWVVAWLLPWVPTWIAGLAAPLVVLDDLGAWSRAPSVSTAVVRLTGFLAESSSGLSFIRSAVPAALVAVTAVVISSRTRAFAPVGRAARGWSGIAAGIVGSHVGLSTVAVGWDVPVVLIVGLNLLGAAVLVWVAVGPRQALRPWFAIGATPFAASGLAWAGLVDQLTVSALGVIAVLAGVVVARGLAALDGTVSDGATAVAGASLVATGFSAGLLGGMDPAHALVLGVGVAAVCSAFAWLADARAPWWASAVELTTVALALGALAALAVGGWADSLSVGLGIVILAAAAHALRSTRRRVAGWTSAVVALVLLWLRLTLADVRAVEPYSLPAAGLLLIAGAQQMRRRPGLGSWPGLGPGLLVAAAPSVVVAILGSEIARPLLVLGVAVVVTILGGQVRLRAPLVVGAVAAAVVAIDQLFPVVAAMPRWVALGSAGVLLLLVGARFERRRRQAAHLYRVYSELR